MVYPIIVIKIKDDQHKFFIDDKKDDVRIHNHIDPFED